MTEKHYILTDADPVVFYGTRGENLQMLKGLVPKLRIVAHDNVLKAIGDEEELAAFDIHFARLQEHCAQFNSLSGEELLRIVKGEKTQRKGAENAILFGVTGKPITARTHNQQRLVQAYNTHDMVFAVGPAGSGKTYTAIALAVRALKNKEIRRIILSRPAVEAGEKLGFLPGDMKEKIDPYLQPLYDALEDMIPRVRLQEMMEAGVIQIAPLAFMRGRTLNDAIVILDEAQNTTPAQIKMFLTRMGMNTKMIITGDLTQVDLPGSQRSGLRDALDILAGIPLIARVDLDKSDIVRHRLVTQIVEAYERRETITSNL